MQIDFHYYCIYVLANLAGYSKDEAKIIAYSSQYTDDSTDSEPVKIGEFVFDTVRTAHNGLKAKRWSVNKKVHIPFHFIPTHPVDESGSFSYITQADSAFARQLVTQACNDDSVLHLYRLGIALHTFADSWAHQNFSGRTHPENNLKALKRSKKGRPLRCPVWWYISNIATDWLYGRVGHLQALKYPDFSHGTWWYKRFKSSSLPDIHNDVRFMNAAETIFFRLAKLQNNATAESIWDANKDKIKELFLYKTRSGKKMLAAKCAKWQDVYSNYFPKDSFAYNENEWKNQAMMQVEKKDISVFRNTDWAKFHQAALMQRYFVLQRIT